MYIFSILASNKDNHKISDEVRNSSTFLTIVHVPLTAELAYSYSLLLNVAKYIGSMKGLK